MLTSSLGHVSVTEVDGTTFTGLYAADGSLNVYDATSDTVPNGLYHPCGAMNITITDGTTLTGRYANNGSLYVVIDSTEYGVYHSCGAMNITGIVVSNAVSFLSEYGPYGMVMDFTDASIAIDDITDVLNYTSIGQVSSGAPVGPGAKLTYTAPSLKLTEQADGNLGFQAHNLAGYSEDFTRAGYWTSLNSVTSVANGAPDYNGNLIATSFTGNGVANQPGIVNETVTHLVGATYSFSFDWKNVSSDSWIKFTAPGGSQAWFDTANLVVGTMGSAWVSVVGTPIGNGYVRITATYVPTSTLYLYTQVVNSDNSVVTTNKSGVFYLCRGQIRRTPSASDYIKTTDAAKYDLPYVYSSGVRTGIMVEPAATNRNVHGNAFGSWTSTAGVTVTADSTVAPDSTTTADTLAFTSTGYIYTNNSTVSSTATLSMTGSVWLKGTPGEKIGLRLVNPNTGLGDSVLITLTANWVRYTLTASIAFTAGNSVSFGLENRSFVVTGTGTAVTLQAWGAQLEDGTVATSFAPTYGSTILRAADNIYMPTSLFPYSATECFLFGEVIWPSAAPINSTIVQINNAGVSSSGPSTYLQVQSATLSNAAWHANNVTKAFASAPTAGSVQRIAATFNTSGTLASATNQGQAVATSALSTWNGTGNRLQIGALNSSGQQMANMVIKKIIYLPVYDTAKAVTVTA